MAILGRFGVSGVFALLYIYTVEMFPTVSCCPCCLIREYQHAAGTLHLHHSCAEMSVQSARNSILGASTLSSRVGGVLTPQISVLARSLGPNIPFTIFGGLGIVSALLTLFLPETAGKAMPDMVEVRWSHHMLFADLGCVKTQPPGNKISYTLCTNLENSIQQISLLLEPIPHGDSDGKGTG